jgi:hypothetical protein
MEDYKKTGEDKNYEYYRGDSEVDSDDGDDETYLKILNKRNEFNVKILDKEVKLSKRSLTKIMILSSSEPEEQVLFSLYKTIPKNSKENLKLKEENKQINNNEIILNEDNNNKINTISNDPLSTPLGSSNNNTQSILIQTNNVINIPNNNNEIDTNTDNEELAFRNNNLDNVVVVGLPPEALKTKWFYLLLALVGICYIIIFLIGIFNKEVGLSLNIFSLFLIGIVIFFTGSFGFVKINKRIYDNIPLFILTFVSMFAGIVGAILVKINETTERYFLICLIFGIISSVFSLICILWMNKLRKNILINKSKKLERLM